MLCVEMRSAVAWLDSPCGSRGSARLILLRFVRLDKSNPWTGDVAKPRDRSGDPRKLLKAKPLLEASLSLTGFAGRTHWPKDIDDKKWDGKTGNPVVEFPRIAHENVPEQSPAAISSSLFQRELEKLPKTRPDQHVECSRTRWLGKGRISPPNHARRSVFIVNLGALLIQPKVHRDGLKRTEVTSTRTDDNQSRRQGICCCRSAKPGPRGESGNHYRTISHRGR
ncbi:predicted protein [Histoplasma capsulatum H143]|uniref:Uncharacterized protein n=1 Tax=Ajellomyces capsulatus (strain H143) TaxID=544712 RepID=C6HMM8_AJECH|nr:predicted protein [Histoplasma capsulatum H143]